MPFAKWSNEFSVGVEEIDGDHQRLLELLNELHDAVKAGGGHEALGRVLDGLMHYVDYHFSHEETLFIRTKYPGYERHRQQHRAFTITVKEIQEDFQLGASDALPQQVLEFLKNWLVEHIQGSDRAFGVYFNAHRAALGIPSRPCRRSRASINLGHMQRGGTAPARMASAKQFLRQHDLARRQLLVRHLRPRDAGCSSAAPPLVHRLDDPPGRAGGVRALQHDFLGPRVVVPAVERLDIHRAQLPLLERVVDALLKRQSCSSSVIENQYLTRMMPERDQHALELGHGREEFLDIPRPSRSP